MATNSQKSLAVAIIQTLRNDIASGKFDAEHNESLEIAIQCLESGYDLKDGDYAFQPSKPLIETFKAAENVSDEPIKKEEVDESTKQKAEDLKNQGNELMKGEKYKEAVEKYSEAIALYKNAPYFSNRAAAYSRLEQHDLCIQDCRTAVAIDPTYSKAYARLGLALSLQYRYPEAVDAYKTALEIDPDNESYKNNLKIAEEKARDAQQQQQRAGQANANPFASLMGGGGGAPGGFDLGSMLNNPAMMQMANQMMSNPQMQQTMAQMMQGLMANQGSQGGGGQGGLADLLNVGQQLAQNMQQANPELVEQLRQQTRQNNQDPNNPNNQDPQNPPPGTG